MTGTSLEAYKRAIKHLHRCYATFDRFCPVTVHLDDDTTWQSFIAVFDLLGHPSAERCYIWPDHEGSHAWRYSAVLHGNGIESAEDAVLWVIAEQKKEQGWLFQHN